MRFVQRAATRLWTLLLSFLRRLRLLPDPYDRRVRLPRVRISVRSPDGREIAMPEVTDDQNEVDRSRFVTVSRHGLVQQGITCPSCGVLAAQKNDVALIHPTRLGECINCPCGKVLLASPDDDVDPVRPGKPYDEALYHTFVRPPVTDLAPCPPVDEAAPIQCGSRVVIRKHFETTIAGRLVDLFGSEATVQSMTTDEQGTERVEVALSGNFGLGGEPSMGGNYVILPRADVAVMETATLRPGDMVDVLRGPHAGLRAKLVSFERGNLTLEGPGGVPVKVAIERVRRVRGT